MNSSRWPILGCWSLHWCCRRLVNSLDFKRSLTCRYANLSHSERNAFNTWPQEDVWSCPLYIQEASRQLSGYRFYERLSADPLQEYQQKEKSTVNEMITTCALPPSAKHLVFTTPCTCCFYLLPKIHKPNNPDQTIVPACSCPTEHISAYLEEVFLPPSVRSLPT